MVRALLVRGMLVGIVAGLLSFGFLKVYGEPQVDRAIAFETQLDEAKAAAEKAKGMKMSDEDEPELISCRPMLGKPGVADAADSGSAPAQSYCAIDAARM
jgi:putative cobalt transporter subunit CbtA